MSSVGSKNVREISDLQFKDGSHYAGQALEGYTGTLPYGYGEMTTKEGFRVRGLFKDGKSQGEGIFVAPNGDTFWGQWNKNHKRHGKGVSVRASDGTICVEEYDDGKLLKKVKRRPPSLATHHWLPPLGLPGTESRHTFTGDVPKAGHTGHSTTVTKDGGLIVLFGGEHANSSSGGGSSLTNDLYMLDVASGVWVKPRTSGTPPPPMQGHTATLVGRQLVIIGGQLGGIEASSSVYVLDIESGSWSCPIAKGLSFMNHTATLIGKEIWVIVQSSVFVLSLANWEWREVETDNRSLPRQIPRSFINHTAVAVGTMIYVHGGKWLGIHHGEGKKYERLSSDVRILHTSSLSWESPSCTPPIVPESDSSSVIQDYSGFVRGSWDVPRCEHTATLVGNKMYIFGGWTTANPTMNVVDTSYLNDLQILDVETMAWQYVAPFPLFIPPRSLHTTTQVGHELWVYGGRNSSAFALGDWNILNLPQGGASNLKKAVKPAAPNSEATTLALTSSTAPPISASSSSSSSSKSSSSFVSQSSTPLPPMPIESTEDELIDEGSAGSGSIMDAFLKG